MERELWEKMQTPGDGVESDQHTPPDDMEKTGSVCEQTLHTVSAMSWQVKGKCQLLAAMLPYTDVMQVKCQN